MSEKITPKIKVMVVDDHPVVREGLSAMLSREKDIEVVGEAQNGSEAVKKATEFRPDIILMDLRMPEMDGIEAMRQIKAANSQVDFIILTTYDTDEYIFKGIEAGARAYLLKDAPRAELFKAIRAVNRGESLMEPGIAGKVLDRLVELSRQTQAPAPESLSEREREVLILIAKGTSNKEIAAHLCIGESTVKTHIQSIFHKLNVNDRTEAVTLAIKKGIVCL
jgi:DNA-binding NarL/FixJ family response regulator